MPCTVAEILICDHNGVVIKTTTISMDSMPMGQELTPDRIRAIRESLGLTQEEAGKLLGGGPRAFTKYENATLEPSTAANSLLRLLEGYPDALWLLREDGSPPVHSEIPIPFQVKGADIGSLTQTSFSELLRRLLHAEAGANGLPANGIHVASNLNAPDGGEDGRISWREGPGHTRWLPSRFCQFQLKAGPISPARAAKDVLTRKGEVKPMVRSALEQDANYIMLCSHRYPQRLVKKRRQAIKDALTTAGLRVSGDLVRFWDGDQIAAWVNHHPSVALWVREELGLGTLGPFASWNHWKGRSEHSIPWVEDHRLSDLLVAFQSGLNTPGTILRVVGLASVGKSRLILEALNRVRRDNVTGHSLPDLVMYAVFSEAGGEAIHPIVEKLAVSGTRAVVVVDDCHARGHSVLAGLVSRQESRLSLVTVDDEIPARLDAATIIVGRANESVIEPIVDHVATELSSLDRQRLVRLSEGFPGVAIRIGRVANANQHLADPADDHLIDHFVLGRTPRNRELLLQSAELLAVFGVFRLEPVEAVGAEVGSEDDLTSIADLGRHLTRDDLYAAIQELIQRGIVKQRGGFGTIEPRPIINRLAERQWRGWDKGKWDRVLSGASGPGLGIAAARRLAQINFSEAIGNVVDHVCRTGGPLDSIDGMDAGRAEVLADLAEINPDSIAEHIDRYLRGLGDLRQVSEGTRRPLVRALSKIAFPSSTFSVGARLMLRLVVTANKALMPWEDASRPFVRLFFPLLGGTEADHDARLQFLDEAANTTDRAQLRHLVDALVAGCDVDANSRTVGPEIHGARKAMHAWYPNSRERAKYIAECVNRLGGLAARNDDIGAKARSDLGGAISSLVCHGFIEAVEEAIQRVIGAGRSWSLALRQLKTVLEHDSDLINDETAERVRVLVDRLEPTSLRERVRVFVSEPPMPGFMETETSISAQLEGHRGIVHALADELLTESPILRALLPSLSRGRQSMADELGEAIARSAPSPLNWLEPITQAVEGIPATDRNYDLLSGFVAGLPARYHDEAEAFKTRAVGSSDLAPAFAKICRRAGLTAEDITRARDALDRGTLSPWDLHHWAFTWVLDSVSPGTVAPLLDAMLDHSAPSFALAVTILGRILSSRGERTDRPGRHVFKLEEFGPQVLKMAGNAGRWSRPDYRPPPTVTVSGFTPTVAEHHFREIVMEVLDRGRGDSDARQIALVLARALALGDHDAWFNPSRIKPSPVLTRLLNGFPEIAWPLIGGAISADSRVANRMKFTLGRPYSFDRDVRPPILDLPEDTLFAWCHANPGGAPAFVAQCVPVLSPDGDKPSDGLLHPVTSRLVDEFGERGDVRRALEGSIRPNSWSGSLASYYSRYRAPLERLCRHREPRVQEWAEKMLQEVEHWIRRETTRDAEREAWGRALG